MYTEELKQEYIAGLNDALILIQCIYNTNLEEALKKFDFENDILCSPITENLDRVITILKKKGE